MILGAITPAASWGGKSTFVKTVRDRLPEGHDALDREESEEDEIILGRLEELAPRRNLHWALDYSQAFLLHNNI